MLDLSLLRMLLHGFCFFYMFIFKHSSLTDIAAVVFVVVVVVVVVV